MAKKKSSGVNKSKEIRDYYRDHPRAKPAQVVEALGGRGVTVSAQQVSTVRYTMKKKKKKPVNGRRKKSAAGARRGGRKKKAAASKEISRLYDAKNMAADLGGIDAARKYLDMLEDLSE